MKKKYGVLLESNPVFRGNLHSICTWVQITVFISENSSESSPTDKAKLKVDFCIESSIGIVKLATGGLYREL